jgi:hypothetical protein
MLAKAEERRRKNGAQFEKTKYILIHLTRNRNIRTDAVICIEGTSILPSKEAKYLGVIFDEDLKFCAHTNQAVKKGAQFGLVIGSIARAKWGAPFHYLLRLFTSIITPRMDYAVAIWHRLEDMRSPTIQQQTKFSTVQRQIMKNDLPHHIDQCIRERNDLLPTTSSPPRKGSQVCNPNAHPPPEISPASMDPTSPRPEMSDIILSDEPRKHHQTFPRIHARSSVEYRGVMIASSNEFTRTLTCTPTSIYKRVLGYIRICIPISISGRGLSSHMLFIRAPSALHHITANTLGKVIALLILFTFRIYTHSFSSVVPQLATLYLPL